jgi:hypothetical protein
MGLAIVREPVSPSRIHPLVGELPLASTCAITSKPVAGGRCRLMRPQFVVVAFASAWCPSSDWPLILPFLRSNRFNPAQAHKTHKLLTPADRTFRRLHRGRGSGEALRSPALRPDPHAGAVFEVSVPVPETRHGRKNANRKQ